jgi:hypothetical protein
MTLEKKRERREAWQRREKAEGSKTIADDGGEIPTGTLYHANVPQGVFAWRSLASIAPCDALFSAAAEETAHGFNLLTGSVHLGGLAKLASTPPAAAIEAALGGS